MMKKYTAECSLSRYQVRGDEVVLKEK